MTITRRGLHEEISRLDDEIASLNKDKAGCFEAYREQLSKDGKQKTAVKLEIEAFKKAERKLRALKKNADAELEKDGLVDEIVAELQSGTINATRGRAPRTNEKPKGQSAEHNARSAPVAATVGTSGMGDAVATNSDALAIETPTGPSQHDSDAAAEMAPSVSAAPIRESDEFGDIRGTMFDRSLWV